MIAYKCKMCGGDLKFEDGLTTCECEFCGSLQTVPSIDNEKKSNLFNRANRLRMNAEFDKAALVYASITAEFPEEAEAYWGLCLCKYGIEYVDDPLTGRKIPTCHRTLPESILDDSDFDQACENADSVAKKLYREEAKAIDRLQQDILDIVAQEKPFDVFICYKETGEDGSRTEDSVLSQDIYDALTEKGLKVFFARITLEDKLGQQYEPYIYAALHSAKVMLAIGTQYDFYDSVWVKNEWARFLDMMKHDRSKTLIPCYKGIDAYDMPREFKNLQAQDMGKLGWIQDLTRGVLKLCGKGEKGRPEEAVPSTMTFQQSVGQNVAALLDRGFLLLEDKEWNQGKDIFEQVLKMDSRNAEAYLGLYMSETNYSTRDEVYSDYVESETIRDNSNFRRMKQFSNGELAQWIKQMEQRRNEIVMERHNEAEYQRATQLMLLEEYDAAVKLFIPLGTYKNSTKYAEQCRASKLIRESMHSIELETADIEKQFINEEQVLLQEKQRALDASNLENTIFFEILDKITACNKKIKNEEDAIRLIYEDIDETHGLFALKKRSEMERELRERRDILSGYEQEKEKLLEEKEKHNKQMHAAYEALSLAEQKLQDLGERRLNQLTRKRYETGLKYKEQGLYMTALSILSKIPEYEDVAEILHSDEHFEQIRRLKTEVPLL